MDAAIQQLEWDPESAIELPQKLTCRPEVETMRLSVVRGGEKRPKLAR